MLGFTRFWEVVFGVDLDAPWQQYLGCNNVCSPVLELQPTEGNAFLAETALATVKWVLTFVPMRKMKKTLSGPHVLVVVSVQQSVQEEFLN